MPKGYHYVKDPERRCQACAGAFHATQDTQRYCSTLCRLDWHKRHAFDQELARRVQAGELAVVDGNGRVRRSWALQRGLQGL